MEDSYVPQQDPEDAHRDNLRSIVTAAGISMVVVLLSWVFRTSGMQVVIAIIWSCVYVAVVAALALMVSDDIGRLKGGAIVLASGVYVLFFVVLFPIVYNSAP